MIKMFPEISERTVHQYSLHDHDVQNHIYTCIFKDLQRQYGTRTLYLNIIEVFFNTCNDSS